MNSFSLNGEIINICHSIYHLDWAVNNSAVNLNAINIAISELYMSTGYVMSKPGNCTLGSKNLCVLKCVNILD